MLYETHVSKIEFRDASPREVLTTIFLHVWKTTCLNTCLYRYIHIRCNIKCLRKRLFNYRSLYYYILSIDLIDHALQERIAGRAELGPRGLQQNTAPWDPPNLAKSKRGFELCFKFTFSRNANSHIDLELCIFWRWPPPAAQISKT